MAFSEILRAKNLVDATGDANVAGMPGFRRGLCTKATGYPLSYDIRGDALFLFVSLTPSQSMPANKTAD